MTAERTMDVGPFKAVMDTMQRIAPGPVTGVMLTPNTFDSIWAYVTYEGEERREVAARFLVSWCDPDVPDDLSTLTLPQE